MSTVEWSAKPAPEPMDVVAANVDVLCADSHKWMYGNEGCAIFYVAESARERVPARARGWWNLKAEGEYLEYRATPYAGARRYEPGTLPTANVAGLSAALDLLNDMGRQAVRDRILELVEVLRKGLEAYD